jgi:hypothetical protein
MCRWKVGREPEQENTMNRIEIKVFVPSTVAVKLALTRWGHALYEPTEQWWQELPLTIREVAAEFLHTGTPGVPTQSGATLTLGGAIGPEAVRAALEQHANEEVAAVEKAVDAAIRDREWLTCDPYTHKPISVLDAPYGLDKLREHPRIKSHVAYLRARLEELHAEWFADLRGKMLGWPDYDLIREAESPRYSALYTDPTIATALARARSNVAETEKKAADAKADSEARALAARRAVIDWAAARDADVKLVDEEQYDAMPAALDFIAQLIADSANFPAVILKRGTKAWVRSKWEERESPQGVHVRASLALRERIAALGIPAEAGVDATGIYRISEEFGDRDDGTDYVRAFTGVPVTIGDKLAVVVNLEG